MNQALKTHQLPGHELAHNTALEDIDPSNPLLWPKARDVGHF